MPSPASSNRPNEAQNKQTEAQPLYLTLGTKLLVGLGLRLFIQSHLRATNSIVSMAENDERDLQDPIQVFEETGTLSLYSEFEIA